MTQEDKELLLKDLCARLPYGVKGIITYDKSNITFTVEGIDNDVIHLSDAEDCYVEDFKPYLRPMSSMTEEENEEFEELFISYSISRDRNCVYHSSRGDLNLEIIDWLNAHHFDYRGLIDKGLALEAPKEMYIHFGDMKVTINVKYKGRF